jgi:phage-related protein
VGVVAYANIVLCPTCDKMRSAVGRTQVARKLPGAELAELIAAASELSRAEDRLARALASARGAGASWAQVGDALDISRQAAQQRFGRNAGQFLAAEEDPLR